MSARQPVLEAALSRFVEAGHSVSVEGAHLRLHNVPVLDQQGKIQLATLITEYSCTDAGISVPSDHTIWYDGPEPFFCDGSSMLPTIKAGDVAGGQLSPTIAAKYHLSNKPPGYSAYALHFDKLMHYWDVLTASAAEREPSSTRLPARGSMGLGTADSPFHYEDACSARGRFTATSARLGGHRIAIVGLGGTGSYVLDHAAKTPVAEIGLFDGDVFEIHNAFRAPGAPDTSQFGRAKVGYFSELYCRMHRNVVAHDMFVTQDNIALLDRYDFVFICVDRGPVRRLITSHLISRGIAFIDCGMDLSLAGDQSIYGSMRVTLSTSERSGHVVHRVPTTDEEGDDLYAQNIQVSDANNLNAILAVMRWKQHLGFYSQVLRPHQLQFMIETLSLGNSDYPGDAIAN